MRTEVVACVLAYQFEYGIKNMHRASPSGNLGGEKKVNSKMNTPGEPLVQEMNPTKCEIAPRRFVTKRGSFEQQRQCMSLCAHKKEKNRRVTVVQIHLSLVESNETVLQNS